MVISTLSSGSKMLRGNYTILLYYYKCGYKHYNGLNMKIKSAR